MRDEYNIEELNPRENPYVKEKEKTPWQSGTEASDWLKERYYKICRTRYRTLRGECFGFAGISILTGTGSAILSSEHWVIYVLIFALITFACLLAAHFTRKQMEKDLAFIPRGEFLYKYDTVKELLPDRYPDTCKIIAEDEACVCIILQAFWYFAKQGTGVYLIKREPKPELSGMATRFCQMDADVQAIIA